jgi:hypothetical protein
MGKFQNKPSAGAFNGRIERANIYRVCVCVCVRACMRYWVMQQIYTLKNIKTSVLLCVGPICE